MGATVSLAVVRMTGTQPGKSLVWMAMSRPPSLRISVPDPSLGQGGFPPTTQCIICGWHAHEFLAHPHAQGMCLRSACDWLLIRSKFYHEAYRHTQHLRPADVEPLAREFSYAMPNGFIIRRIERDYYSLLSLTALTVMRAADSAMLVGPEYGNLL